MIGRLKRVFVRSSNSGKQFVSDRSAVSAIEFSILALPFFLIAFAILGTGIAFIGELTLDNAIAANSRLIMTGEAAKTGMSEADFRNKICKSTYGLFTCADLKIDVRAYSSFSGLPKNAPLSGADKKKVLNTSGFSFNAGASDALMAVQVYYEWPIFISPLQAFFSNMQSGDYLVGSILAFKTEPFDAN